MATQNRRVQRIGAVLASRLVAVDRKKVRFIYREEPDNEYDSGWRVFAGEEDQAFADDPNNFALYDANTIAEIDPDIIPLLNHAPPCAFQRKDANSPFEEATDYEFTPENGE